MQSQHAVLGLEQAQKLSPQLIHSLKILAMPVAELQTEIQAQLEANPSLELLEGRESLSIDIATDSPRTEVLGDNNDEVPNTSPNGPEVRRGGGEIMEAFLPSYDETLQEHLLGQLNLLKISTELYLVCRLLIENLDEDGFHRLAPEELLAAQKANAAKPPPKLSPKKNSLLKKALTLVQGLEPQGCATRDFKESLAVQAGLRSDLDPAVPLLLAEGLELLGESRYAEVRKKFQLSEEELSWALEDIRKLQPYPGRAYSSKQVRFISPDITVTRKRGGFTISLGGQDIPLLGISPFFEKLAQQKIPPRAAKTASKPENNSQKYAREHVQKAQEFIGAIKYRNDNLVRLMRAIVKHQRDFFWWGPSSLHPLTMSDIAKELELHETTVSRIAGAKYVQTDFGIFEIRYFFTNSISGSGSSGSSHSKEGVKSQIAALLKEENSLSDAELTRKLATKGITIARRTVAKYRSELAIDTSFTRKRREKQS